MVSAVFHTSIQTAAEARANRLAKDGALAAPEVATPMVAKLQKTRAPFDWNALWMKLLPPIFVKR